MYVFMKMLHLILLFLFLDFDLKVRTINIDGKRIKLEICDTTNVERFTEMYDEYWYYRHANVSWIVVKFVILKLFI